MKHIFVVDDERNIRDLIRKYLEKEGYQVTVFESAKNVVLKSTA
jgi:DNA-binding response OmpR family regulator